MRFSPPRTSCLAWQGTQLPVTGNVKYFGGVYTWPGYSQEFLQEYLSSLAPSFEDIGWAFGKPK